LILASPGANIADVMKLWADVARNSDAGRCQDQVLA
jgi:hypothetical protein